MLTAWEEVHYTNLRMTGRNRCVGGGGDRGGSALRFALALTETCHQKPKSELQTPAAPRSLGGDIRKMHL